MKMMRRIVSLALLASAAFAQQKPPKKVDAALRARVSEFYQDHVTEQYRKAEKLVAPESQEIFYVREKPKYEAFEIKSIEYRDKFKSAKVTVTVSQFGHAAGFSGQLLKTPSLSTWKLVKGKWMWYVDKEELAKGPFGPSANAGTKPPPGYVPPKIELPSDASMALNHVALDKTSLVVKPGDTERVEITNNSLGTVMLEIEQVLPDIKVTLDKTSINRGEKAVATLKCAENPNAGEIAFHVMPTNETLVVQIKRQPTGPPPQEK